MRLSILGILIGLVIFQTIWDSRTKPIDINFFGIKSNLKLLELILVSKF